MLQKRPSGDFHSEIDAHIRLEADRLREQGMSEADALLAARRAFGNVTRTEERYYESSRWAALDRLRRNIGFGMRLLARSPGYSLIIIVTLALGIGANTAIFSLLNAVLLRQLPVQKPAELVLFGDGRASGDSGGLPDGDTRLFSYDTLHQYQRRTHVFSGVAATRSTLFDTHGHIGSGSELERIRTELVSGTYFPTLGVTPALGRLFGPSDDVTPGGHPVAVASYSWWQGRLGRKSAAVGSTVTINDAVFTIVGVAAPNFMGITVGQSPDLWVPLAMEKQIAPGWTGLDNTLFQSLHVFARLKPGVGMTEAAADTNILFQQIIHEYAGPQATPKELAAISRAHVQITPAATGLSRLRRKISSPLQILMVVVGVVLLIACANVANLLLARASSRQRELAVRMSIGAPRSHLIQQLFLESSLLGVAGGVLGIGLAWWAGGLLVSMISPGADPIALRVAPDGTVLGFALLVTMATVILFGTLPAFRATKIHLSSTLKEGRGTAGASVQNTLARSLVVAQVALSLALVVGAGLFLRSLSNLERVNTGFDARNAVVVSVDPTAAGYRKGPRLAALMKRLEDRVAAVPGVEAAGFALTVFNQGSWSGSVRVPGHTESDRDPDVDHNRVGAGYLRAMGMPILLGREFTARDVAGSPKVAVVNETFVRAYLDGTPPLGRTFSIEDDAEWQNLQIIGVVRDAKYLSLQEKQRPAAFYPHAQHPSLLENLVVRYSGGSKNLIPRLRQAAAEVDPKLPLSDFTPLSQLVDSSMHDSRLVAQLCAVFAILAALLASIGIYGVMSYATSRRTNEFGIRMALGAIRGDVLWMVLRETLGLLLIGLVAGVGVALAAGRFVESVLFGVKAADPLAIVGAILLMTVVGLVAGWLPARRATRIDPMRALRYE